MSAYDNSFRRVVAVVDDDIDISILFHDILCENVQDASVYAFNDPIEALKHFTENQSKYALVISDLRMAGLKWSGAAQESKEFQSKSKNYSYECLQF